MYRFQKQVRGATLVSPAIFRTQGEAVTAEAEAITEFLKTGRLPTFAPDCGQGSGETIIERYTRWIKWLHMHRSPRHYRDNEGIIGRALAIWPEMADKPADALDEATVEAWGERWAEDLFDRGKGAGEVNKWLVASQTAWNEPWGKRRARRIHQENPFAYVERYAVEKKAKYVPTPKEVAAVLLAAGQEFKLYLGILEQTAARPGEGRKLAWENVQGDTVVLHTKKTRDGSRIPRRLAIDENLASQFQAWRRAQGPGSLHVFRQAEVDKPRREIWERKRMLATCAAAGVEYFPVGCFRHYRASMWAREGLDFVKIQGRLGHTVATTTNNYLKEIRAL